jgi:hypothetical protein
MINLEEANCAWSEACGDELVSSRAAIKIVGFVRRLS